MQCMQQRFKKFVRKKDVPQLNNLFCESNKGNSQKTYAVDRSSQPFVKSFPPKEQRKENKIWRIKILLISTFLDKN